MKQTFTFVTASTKTLSATTSSSSTALSVKGDTILITNAGDNTVFIELGDSTVTAATTGLPILPNSAQTINRGAAEYIAVISNYTSTVYVSDGYGV
jgi:hypothetical protein